MLGVIYCRVMVVVNFFYPHNFPLPANLTIFCFKLIVESFYGNYKRNIKTNLLKISNLLYVDF